MDELSRTESTRSEQNPLGSPGYYGLPVLKKPIWRWEIWSYFFLGGLAAGSFVVASLALLFGDREDRPIVRAGYLVSAVALLLCPPLLIKDLGRPGRFLNMLRVVKPQSPMSLGVWALTGFSACVFPMALKQVVADEATITKLIPGRLLATVGSVLGCFVGGYTGVLLSTTSVPLWSRSRFLGPTFLASALSASVSAIVLVLTLGRSIAPTSLRKLERLKQFALAGETVALAGFLGETSWAGRPLVEPKQHGRAFIGGAIILGIVVPGLASLGGNNRSRQSLILRSLAALIGGLFLRYSIVSGGRASAADPEAYFRHTDVPIGRTSQS
jgi:formate-dependent nitrite reductase membrane component NrfD